MHRAWYQYTALRFHQVPLDVWVYVLDPMLRCTQRSGRQLLLQQQPNVEFNPRLAEYYTNHGYIVLGRDLMYDIKYVPSTTYDEFVTWYNNHEPNYVQVTTAVQYFLKDNILSTTGRQKHAVFFIHNHHYIACQPTIAISAWTDQLIIYRKYRYKHTVTYHHLHTGALQRSVKLDYPVKALAVDRAGIVGVLCRRAAEIDMRRMTLYLLYPGGTILSLSICDDKKLLRTIVVTEDGQFVVTGLTGQQCIF